MKLKSLVLAAASLLAVGCGEKAQVVTNGAISATCSTDWYQNPQKDVFTGELKNNDLYLTKGSSVENMLDMTAYASMEIAYDAESELTDGREFIDGIIGDISFTVNGVEWKGYNYKTGNYENAVLYNQANKHVMATFYKGGDSSSIEFDSDEVKAILGSVVIK